MLDKQKKVHFAVTHTDYINGINLLTVNLSVKSHNIDPFCLLMFKSYQDETLLYQRKV